MVFSHIFVSKSPSQRKIFKILYVQRAKIQKIINLIAKNFELF